ncbi:E3 ubiquitin-protein ligase RNF144B-like [Cynara cardunculus var. scolymus]|uniref:E3 ubiquitin-protein ligase RNF144B-like n=1 Tax=Cynara cardunculus var. scolymus TaxID=59895 RepID=UPI000D6302C7|nr:E3 ubiquitin-protein ligase RNF144B-like [Cynara cardunculus var. scolymus]
MFTGLNQLINLNFTLHKPSSTTGDIWYAAGPIALLMFASLVYSISSKNRKELNIGSYDHVGTEIAEAATGLFQRSDDDELSWKSASDVLLQEDNDEIISKDDAKYAEELQVQEALLASISSSQTTDSASSSTHKARTSLGSWLKNKEVEIADPTLNICKICLENQESWKMFKNSTCSHSFCYECTSKHATTKIQENNNTIKCPGLNCKSALDFNALRLIIPKDVLMKWDEMLCESTILESHKLYCPFADCSVLLINDDISISKIDCPVCRRSFCAVCRVPWHSEFTCKEFEKLNSKKKGKKDDGMAVALAKKKNWKKCPSCKFFVEKAEGCLHITCRCKYEFCYNCRAKWSSNHGGCKPRS